MVIFFSLMVCATGVRLSLFESIERILHSGFVASVLAPDRVGGVARFALSAHRLRTRCGPPAGIDERSLCINSGTREWLSLSRCVLVLSHEVEPSLDGCASLVMEVGQSAVAHQFDKMLDVDCAAGEDEHAFERGSRLFEAGERKPSDLDGAMVSNKLQSCGYQGVGSMAGHEGAI